MGIAILDTGISDAQQQFSLQYDYYPRRQLLQLNETTETSNDECSHGTKMASVAAAPQDGRSIVGIAWDADLTSIKVTETPHATKSNVATICAGIRDAISPPDGRAPAQVVAMAFGLTYYSPTVADCIMTAYQASPNTIFVAAAGSTVPDVIFPAHLDCCVLAVSMVEVHGDGYRLMSRPLTVAYGRSVDLVSASTSGGIPASGLRGTAVVDEIARFSWSSAATATYVGLVALASRYARLRGWNRDQLLSVLSECSSRANITDFSGEPLEAVVGAGILDAYCATGGARHARIAGPTEAEVGGRLYLQALTDDGRPMGAPPPDQFSYSWTVDGVRVSTSASVSVETSRPGSRNVGLEVRDTLDGTTLRATKSILITQPSDVKLVGLRDLYWTSYVADWATFLNGGRHDRVVNAGATMPDGCEVQKVLGLLVDSTGKPEPNQTPRPSFDAGSHGFEISRPSGHAANDLEVVVHQWHDGFSAVRTKVVYVVYQPRGIDCLVPGLLTDG